MDNSPLTEAYTSWRLDQLRQAGEARNGAATPQTSPDPWHDTPDAPLLGWVAVCLCRWVGRSATRPGACVWRDWHPDHTDVAGEHMTMVIAVRPRPVAEVSR